jgi:hypothetical protein
VSGGARRRRWSSSATLGRDEDAAMRSTVLREKVSGEGRRRVRMATA